MVLFMVAQKNAKLLFTTTTCEELMRAIFLRLCNYSLCLLGNTGVKLPLLTALACVRVGILVK